MKLRLRLVLSKTSGYPNCTILQGKNCKSRSPWLQTHDTLGSYPVQKARGLTDTAPTMLRSPKPPILIVGAGLSGLSLAAILQKSDVPYMVFDSSTRQRTQRHGITLHPWAYSPLLSALDVKLEELRSAVAVDSAIGGSGRVDTAMRDVYTGKILDSEIKALQSQASHHAKPLRAKKSLMRDFLLDKLDTSKLYWDWKLKSIRHGDESVVAEFDNGKTMVGRFLVAADGLHSVGMTGLSQATYAMFLG